MPLGAYSFPEQSCADMLDKATKRSLYLGLVDILFAFAYDFRSTEREGTVSIFI